MITNFKMFEENDNIYFSVGDEVTCIIGDDIDNMYSVPKKGKKYLVLRIYCDDSEHQKNTIMIEHQYLTIEDIDFFSVDIKDIETGEILEDWLAYRFISEIRINSNKYNL